MGPAGKRGLRGSARGLSLESDVGDQSLTRFNQFIFSGIRLSLFRDPEHFKGPYIGFLEGLRYLRQLMSA